MSRARRGGVVRDLGTPLLRGGVALCKYLQVAHLSSQNREAKIGLGAHSQVLEECAQCGRAGLTPSSNQASRLRMGLALEDHGSNGDLLARRACLEEGVSPALPHCAHSSSTCGPNPVAEETCGRRSGGSSGQPEQNGKPFGRRARSLGGPALGSARAASVAVSGCARRLRCSIGGAASAGAATARSVLALDAGRGDGGCRSLHPGEP